MPESTHQMPFMYLCILVLCFYGKNTAYTSPRPDVTEKEVKLFFPDRCSAEWLQYQNHCIKFYPERKTWSEAREMCRAGKGDLVMIHDEKKQHFVYNTFAVRKTLWIGLKRDENDVFHWVDGTKLQFANWIKGSPDSFSEKCGEMTDYGAFRGKWNDKACSTSQPFICETAINFNNVFKIFPGKMLIGHVINRFTVKSDVECLLRCQRYPGCESTNFVHSSSKDKTICELNGQTKSEESEHLYTSEWSSYYHLIYLFSS